MRRLLFVGLLLMTAPALPAQDVSVGVMARMESVILPGPELEPKPIDSRKTPVVVRFTAVYPHGSDFRYDLEWYGLDPGSYDLKDFLQRKDGKPATGLPALPVKVTSIRPPGQVEPNALVIDPGPRLGGYGTAVVAVAVAWTLGLVAILASFVFPRRRVAVAEAKPVSLADKLSPLVEGAMSGKLSTSELAALERSLMAYWRKKLRLDATEPTVAMDRLRADADAGPLLTQLETWLHRPGTRGAVNVGELLRPYRDLRADELDLAGATK